jgi:hypothetical protein
MNEDSDKEDQAYSVKVGDAVYSFGGPCPPIQSMFFPQDLEKKEEEGDQNDTAQPS